MSYFIKPTIFKLFSGLFFTTVFISCGAKLPISKNIDSEIKIDPDYSGITLPPNIAPLNFKISEKADKYLVHFDSRENYSFNISSDKGQVKIPENKWKKLLNRAKGKDIYIDVYTKKNNQWAKYKTITNHISRDSIDQYLVYRLLSPGFELWQKMGIYQRNVENFREEPVFLSSLSDNSCMNCHSFCKNNPNRMMFHLRGKLGGTVIQRDGEAILLNTKTDQTISAAVYPAWHPGGKYIAYSVNQIVQSFHSIPKKKVEVMDTLSDLVLLDIDQKILLKSKRLATKENLETFPAWSPDGKYLYYCSAPVLPPDRFDQIRYSLMRIAFDPVSLNFGQIDTVISSHQTGLSISFPKISPDGKYLMFCMFKYGNFSIWHRESDLYLLNLTNNQITKPNINSPYSESYHQWSSNGKWIVFSSRRNNKLFTRLYFSSVDEQGNVKKPFILPQNDPEFYEEFMKSFNIPELITSKIKSSPQEFARISRTKAVNLQAKIIE